MTNEQSERWLAILIQANPVRGLSTKQVAAKVGCSQRLVQTVVKCFKDLGRSKFFNKINGGSIWHTTYNKDIITPVTVWRGTVGL